MKNKNLKKIIAIICITILVMPLKRTFAQYYDCKKIENNSTLTAKQVNVIFDFLCDSLEEKYGKYYDIENYQALFSDTIVAENEYYVDVDVFFDMTLVENPVNSAYVKGMKAEVQRTEGKEQKDNAKRAYDELVEELLMNYNQKQKTCITYRVSLPKTVQDNFDVEDIVFSYRCDVGNGECELFSTEFEDDSVCALDEEDGQEAIRGLMQIMSRTFDEPTYDRTAAVAYAVAHATEVPEFSAENNNGSDCANFVSKCLHAGGIPIDVAGEWYPKAANAAYAGVNWMRTGYYGNGGIIPYMTGKDYFSYVSTATPQIGRILYWNNSSHVALITYADQYGTVKYTQHSDVTQTVVYYLYTPNIASGTTIYVSNLLWN